MAMKEKKVITSVQLTVEQKKRLDTLARYRGIGPSTLLRQIVMERLETEMPLTEFMADVKDGLEGIAYYNAITNKPQPTFTQVSKLASSRIGMLQGQISWLRQSWWKKVCNKAKKFADTNTVKKTVRRKIRS
jgi:predicted DNA-binding protein